MTPTGLSGVDGHALLQRVYEHLRAQLSPDNGYAAVRSLAGVPEVATVAWHIWWFIAEAGGSGVPCYLANDVSSIDEVCAIRSALVSVEATELVTLLDAALSLEEVASSMSSLPDNSSLDPFRVGAPRLSWEQIERRSFELISGPLSDLAGAYIKRHADALC